MSDKQKMLNNKCAGGWRSTPNNQLTRTVIGKKWAYRDRLEAIAAVGVVQRLAARSNKRLQATRSKQRARSYSLGDECMTAIGPIGRGSGRTKFVSRASLLST